MEGTEEFILKKREMTFRDRVWYVFEGNLYRNVTEISSIMESFPVKKHEFILEVGAGSGRFTKVFAEAGAEVVALDISRNSLKTNRKKTRCHAIVADLCYLPFRDSVFDKAAALHVFQYVPSHKGRLKGLREIKRVVKERALFVIEVYNYRFWDRIKINGKEGFHVRVSPPIYYYRFDKREFKSTLASVFSRIIAIKPTLIFHPVLDTTRIGEVPTIVRMFQTFEKLLMRTPIPYVIACGVACVCQK